MKRLLFLCLIATTASAQCDTERSALAFLSIPSFFSLYFAGDCISQPIHDTTICVAFPPSAVGRIAAFSYSSPSGQPAYVTGFSQYNSDCVHIANGPNIYPSADTTYVCYTIQAALIDNFCPYSIIASGLSVQFCGVSAAYEQNFVRIGFSTCSNTGTEKYRIQASTDAITFADVYELPPAFQVSPDRSNYTATFKYTTAGMNYFRVAEHDLNGKITYSEIVPLSVPAPVRPSQSFDILGRENVSGTFLITR